MTREEAKDVFLNRGFIKVENCRERIFRGDKWREACMIISEWLKEEQKWIPVSERLPEDGEVILFSTKTDRVFEGRYFADNTDRQWYAFRDETFAWNNVVIAWMPLPEPYEPQESEK